MTNSPSRQFFMFSLGALSVLIVQIVNRNVERRESLVRESPLDFPLERNSISQSSDSPQSLSSSIQTLIPLFNSLTNEIHSNLISSPIQRQIWIQQLNQILSTAMTIQSALVSIGSEESLELINNLVIQCNSVLASLEHVSVQSEESPILPLESPVEYPPWDDSLDLQDDQDDVQLDSPSLEIIQSHTLELLSGIGEEHAKQSHIHHGFSCINCHSSPIRGIRYQCCHCQNINLCESCESLGIHAQNHVLIKIRIPTFPLSRPLPIIPKFYPGNDFLPSSPPTHLIESLSKSTHFSEYEISALYPQWKSLSGSENGIDKHHFLLGLGPLAKQENLIIDRFFTFFDSNQDGFISFSEFCNAMSIIVKGTFKQRLEFAFKGYDLNSDNFIQKSEMRKIFTSFFRLSMDLVRDVVKQRMEDQVIQQFQDDSTNPVSQAFQHRVPPEDEEPIVRRKVPSDSMRLSRMGSNSANLSTTLSNNGTNMILDRIPSEEEVLDDGISFLKPNHLKLITPTSTLEKVEQGYVSIEAISEMVDKIFDGREEIEWKEFINVVNDEPLLNWTEALGTLF